MGSKKPQPPASKKPKETPAAAPPVPAPAPQPTTPPASPPRAAHEPRFVREASPAERKAALEAVLEKQAVPVVRAPPPPTTAPGRPMPPPFVMDSSPALRKAAVEQLAEESGVKSVLARAPWKRTPGTTVETAPPAPPVSPTPGAPQKEAPRATMTKAPIEATTGRSPQKTVILDSNALMMQFQFHIDIEREVKRILGGNYEVVVPSIVVEELDRLVKTATGKDQGVARMAAELARTFKVVESPGDGDVGILRLAEKLNAIVVTNDRALRARCRAKELPTIHMRSSAYLTIEGHVQGL
jgi:rRNA-processing protein FCF1